MSDEAEPTVTEYMVRALMAALVDRGVLSEDNLLAAAATIAKTEHESAQMAAYLIRLDVLRDRDVAGPILTPEQMARKRDMIARTRYIEAHGRTPPKTFEEAFERLRDVTPSDGGNEQS